mmetsp:Transcript_21432/g.72619  ORF Transcript_21432/g.72619 Transcript_21432/m.72619 type:complete len:262 (+) Transcript_21432:2976-3761(+)
MQRFAALREATTKSSSEKSWCAANRVQHLVPSPMSFSEPLTMEAPGRSWSACMPTSHASSAFAASFRVPVLGARCQRPACATSSPRVLVSPSRIQARPAASAARVAWSVSAKCPRAEMAVRPVGERYVTPICSGGSTWGKRIHSVEGSRMPSSVCSYAWVPSRTRKQTPPLPFFESLRMMEKPGRSVLVTGCAAGSDFVSCSAMIETVAPSSASASRRDASCISFEASELMLSERTTTSTAPSTRHGTPRCVPESPAMDLE